VNIVTVNNPDMIAQEVASKFEPRTRYKAELALEGNIMGRIDRRVDGRRAVDMIFIGL
jgi:hypothetical protein